ncbi:MAG TPA: MATE family efflux transporter [Bacilli bacterium]|nr:MATE family efflux transporter [Acholeplasmataceae bacterium]HOA78659.1 MATE family efflux transporter [Bacilli bacterium]HPZ27177.1 MATE family efflux transporter [Bacilli bacterium]HQC88841.1 MATE family efflux transporter [Bacilli bacterium]
MHKEKSLKMRDMPVGRLLARMSIPAMTSMMIQALYNIVDTFYVSLIDPSSNIMITAVGYALPMQIIIMAFALGIGIGTTVLVARKLGERNKREASNVAQTGLIMALVSGGVFFVLSFFVSGPFMDLMSDIPDIIYYGQQYLRIVMMFSVFLFIEIVCNKILQGQGRMIVPMITQIIGAVVNIILDPILIFGWFGLPEFGVRGAAIATIIGQCCAMIFVLIYIFTQKMDINLNIRNLKIRGRYIGEIFKTGAPTILINSIGSLTNIALNNILKGIDVEEKANAVLTLYFKIQNFVFMPVFGLNQGGLPILSYNYGSGDKERYMRTFGLMLRSAFIILFIGFIIFQAFPEGLIRIFTSEESTISIGKNAFRIISLSFLPAAFGIILTVTFQSISYGHSALLMSFLRQALLLIPSAFLLGKFLGLKYIWLSFPISEFIVAVVFYPIIRKIINEVFARKKVEQRMTEYQT